MKYRNQAHSSSCDTQRVSYDGTLSKDGLESQLKATGCLLRILDATKNCQNDIDSFFGKIVEMLPSGWQHSRSAVTRIYFGDKVYQSSAMKSCISIQAAEIRMEGEVRGSVEVGYTKEFEEADEGPFLLEERVLIESVSRFVGQVITGILTEEKRKQSQSYLRSTLDGLSAQVTVLDEEGNIIFTNLAYRKFAVQSGVSLDAVGEGTNYCAVCESASGPDSEEASRFSQGIRNVLTGHSNYFELEYPCHSLDEFRWFVGRVSPFFDHGLRRVIVEYEDITERKLAEEDQRLTLARIERLARHVPGMLFQYRLRADGTSHLPYASEGVEEIYGVTPDQVVDDASLVFEMIHPDDVAEVNESIQRSAHGLTVWRSEHRVNLSAGRTIWVEGEASPKAIAGGDILWHGYIRDITDRKHAKQEQEKLRGQLNQIQKMGSVGQLVGGVAHDFNNMLGVIFGNTQLAQLRLSPTEPIQANLKAILDAAQRSADLTRQLLAFARKESIVPRVLDFNDVVVSMLKMLQRIIGENIDLLLKPEENLWSVRMDPSQIDQILVNLCVNARDAIDGVGKITIESSNAVLDEDYCRLNGDIVPGEYVLLAVSDNGCGMDAETLSQIFDPFFTTKEVGKGTGLGLATVHGAVKQNNGSIDVYSESGFGTTFRIYLPRYTANVES